MPILCSCRGAFDVGRTWKVVSRHAASVSSPLLGFGRSGYATLGVRAEGDFHDCLSVQSSGVKFLTLPKEDHETGI